ncbi:GtrA family protein [Candidatus Saccharibacteria bacterium]|nr:GtrA family protein [Candidatus Saccharibacteria bacterium]
MAAIARIQELLKKPGMRYLIVGGSVYVLELIIIVVAQRLGATPVQAVALSFLVGLFVSFLMQKLFTFGDKRMHHKVVIPQVVAVTLLVIFNLGFTVGVTKLLQDVLPAVITRTLALGTTTIWNFYLYKTRIFNQDKTQETILVD